MRELVTMWRHTKMVVLVALTAAVYAAILIPFKGIPLIPGITEVRPANVVPVVFSLLFGPAAAWGSAIGNLIGDLFGTLGPGSFFGFIGNFFFGLVPYAIWGHMGVLSAGVEPDMRSRRGRQVLEYALVAFLASTVCAVIIAWGLEVLKMLPFAVLGNIITVNNFLAAIILGPILLYILYPRVKRWGLLWTDIMPEEEIGRRAPAARTALLWLGGLVALILGNYLSIGVYRASAFAAGFQQFGNLAVVGKLGIVGGLAPLIALILLATFL